MKSLVKRNNEIKYKKYEQQLKWDFIYIVGARKKCFQLMRSLNIRAVNPHSYKMLIFFYFKLEALTYVNFIYICFIHATYKQLNHSVWSRQSHRSHFP